MVMLIIITRGKTIDFKVLVNTSVEGLQGFLTGVERVLKEHAKTCPLGLTAELVLQLNLIYPAIPKGHPVLY